MSESEIRGSCVMLRNPCDPSDIIQYPIDHAVSVANLALAHGIDVSRLPVICRLNGKWLLQRDWSTTQAIPTSIVEFHCIAGNGGGSFLRTALSLALVVAVAFAAGPAGAAISGALGGVFSATTSSALFSAVALSGGSFLLNALIPSNAPKPTSGDSSPTYNMSIQSNQARLGGTIPVLYGNSVIYCDYAATPYSFYDGGQEYFRAALVMSQGDVVLNQMRVGDLTTLPDITLGQYGPDESFTMFNPNVFQSPDVAGIVLVATNEPFYNWSGPFDLCPPGKTVDSCTIDIAWAQGLFGVTPSTGALKDTTVNWTVQYRDVDDNGNPLAGWNTLGFETMTSQSSSPLYQSYTYDFVAAARRQVRLQRTTEKPTTNGQDATTLVRVKGNIYNAPTTFGDVSLLGAQMRTSNSVATSSAQRLSTICTRKLPAYIDGSWQPAQSSRAIAWAIADVLRNTTYGAGLPDSMIELDDLVALNDIWAARGDTFDAVFDQPITVAEALTRICRAGRAKWYIQSGKYRFYRDQPEDLPVAMFSVSNIDLDSFQLDFALPVPGQTANAVTVQYFDRLTWSNKTVTAGINGEDADDPAVSDLFGVTDSTKALSVAQYESASNRYRRVFATFATEMAGMIPSPGNLIVIAHDVPNWGQSGDVIGYDSNTRVLKLAGAVDLEGDHTTWTIQLRDNRGRPSKQILISAGVVDDRVVLAEQPVYADGSPFTITTDYDREPTHFAIGTSSNKPRLAKVIDISPAKRNSITIKAVIDDPRVYVD